MPVKVGDIVVFAKYAGTEVKVEGEDYWSCGRRTCSPSWREEEVEEVVAPARELSRG